MHFKRDHARPVEKFGERRVLDRPISEAALAGPAAGAAIDGMRPVVEIQFFDLLPLAMNQLACHAACYHYMTTGGRIHVPMVMRNKLAMRPGGRREPLELQCRGVPSFSRLEDQPADDAGGRLGLMLAAIRDPNRVLCFEGYDFYGVRGPVPEGDFTVPIDAAAVRRLGRDLTIVTGAVWS